MQFHRGVNTKPIMVNENLVEIYSCIKLKPNIIFKWVIYIVLMTSGNVLRIVCDEWWKYNRRSHSKTKKTELKLKLNCTIHYFIEANLIKKLIKKLIEKLIKKLIKMNDLKKRDSIQK